MCVIFLALSSPQMEFFLCVGSKSPELIIILFVTKPKGLSNVCFPVKINIAVGARLTDMFIDLCVEVLDEWIIYAKAVI